MAATTPCRLESGESEKILMQKLKKVTTSFSNSKTIVLYRIESSSFMGCGASKITSTVSTTSPTNRQSLSTKKLTHADAPLLTLTVFDDTQGEKQVAYDSL